MEDFENEVPQEVKLVVTEEMRSYFYDMSKWARFLSVVGFVISAFLTLSSFGIGAAITANPAMLNQLGPLAGIGATGITIFYLLLALLFFTQVYYCYVFQLRANKACCLAIRKV
ncbi:hypothetical protein [Pedobacter sp. P26]|uniref:hypothetical protein n=1 Tax=Pedobacter sp. P26 TaxID=3423956 RepID=UPI003D6696CE